MPLIALIATYTCTRHAHTHSHMQTAHMLISAARLSQTVGNPPPLKQKDLFLSCTHARVSVVFSAETKNITLIPTDLCRVTKQWVRL